jgi:hypothetical protein
MYIVAVVVGAALMAAGVGHFIASSLQLLELQSEVNERLPQPDKFEPLFWSFGKRLQLRRLQRSLLPQSPRPGRAMRFGVIGACLFFSGVAMLLFGLRGIYEP